VGLEGLEKFIDPAVTVPRGEVAKRAPPFVVSTKETVPVGDPVLDDTTAFSV
jgi:hypothetical protein